MKHFTNFLKFLVFLSVGLVILYLLYNNLNKGYQEQCVIDNIPAADCVLIDKVIEDFKSVNYFWVLVINLCFVISNISRALRWNQLLKPMGYRPKFINSFFCVVIGYFGNLGLPRLGEILRPVTLSRYEKIPVEKVMGTIVVDRIMDIIALAALIGLAFCFEFDTLWNWLKPYLETKGSTSLFANPIIRWLLTAGCALLLFLFLMRKKIMQSAFYDKVLNLLKGFWEGIQSIRQLDKPGMFVFHTLVIWLMYYFMTYLAFFSFAPTEHLAPVAGLVVFVFGAFGIVIPSPGGMGTYHWLVIAALSIYSIDKIDAFSFANIAFFSIQIFCNVVLGLIALSLLPILNRDYNPVVEQTISDESLSKT